MFNLLALRVLLSRGAPVYKKENGVWTGDWFREGMNNGELKVQ